MLLYLYIIIVAATTQRARACAARGGDCTSLTCCSDSRQRCYKQHATRSRCRDAGTCPSNWDCTVVVRQVQPWGECSGDPAVDACVSPSSSTASYECYRENAGYAQCRPTGDCPFWWDCAGSGSDSDSDTENPFTHLALATDASDGARYFLIRVRYEDTTTLRRALESLKLLHGTSQLTEAMWHFLFEVSKQKYICSASHRCADGAVYAQAEPLLTAAA
jgi:hypothetical protein